MLSQGPTLTPFKWNLPAHIVSPVPVNLLMIHEGLPTAGDDRKWFD